MMSSRRHTSCEQGNRTFHNLLRLMVVVLVWGSLASAQQWVPVTLPFPGRAGTALVRTDGNVMVEDKDTGWWWLLVPDDTGDYANGFWFPPFFPIHYDPAGFASAVLRDGRIIVEGGEHNFGKKVDTTFGAILDPETEMWTEVPRSQGLEKIRRCIFGGPARRHVHVRTVLQDHKTVASQHRYFEMDAHRRRKRGQQLRRRVDVVAQWQGAHD